MWSLDICIRKAVEHINWSLMRPSRTMKKNGSAESNGDYDNPAHMVLEEDIN